MDWVEFFTRFGVTAGVLVLILVFLGRSLWPAALKAWEDQQKERREERTQFLNALTDERKAFKAAVDEERQSRIQESQRFLAALELHGRQIATMAETNTKILQALERTEKPARTRRGRTSQKEPKE